MFQFDPDPKFGPKIHYKIVLKWVFWDGDANRFQLL